MPASRKIVARIAAATIFVALASVLGFQRWKILSYFGFYNNRLCRKDGIFFKRGGSINLRVIRRMERNGDYGLLSCTLMKALRDNNLPLIDLLIDNVADFSVNKPIRYELSPLAYARGKKVTQFLIDKGASVKIRDAKRQTALFYSLDDRETTQTLIENGAIVNAQDSRGKTPLFFAENKEVAQTLIENGANANIKDRRERTPLFFAENGEVAQVLIKNGASVSIEDNMGMTPLHSVLVAKSHSYHSTASVSKREEEEKSLIAIAQQLIENGADVDAKDNEGKTPLFYARIPTIAQLLIDNGADVNTRDRNNKTVLFEIEDDETLQTLIDNGADVSAKDNKGQTPLFDAENFRGTNKLTTLIKNGADVNAKDKDNRTPLFFVRYDSAAQELVNKGADVNAKDKNNQTPLFFVKSKRMTEKLIELGASLKVKDNKNHTPITALIFKAKCENPEYVIRGYIEILEILVDGNIENNVNYKAENCEV
ncbi:MAG: ankyrin repeat domain-containing protein [Cyanobacteria bacterium J06600_6]